MSAKIPFKPGWPGMRFDVIPGKEDCETCRNTGYVTIHGAPRRRNNVPHFDYPCECGRDPIRFLQDEVIRKTTRSSTWTRITDAPPEHTNWVLIVIDGKTREVPDHIGLGWRKRDSAGRPTGWWETNLGLMTDKHIKYWTEPPALPRHG